MLRPLPGGRFTAANLTLKQLIAWAYQVRGSQVNGGPGWVDSDRFDVAAKSEGNPGYDYLNPGLQMMFQSVLQERCKLGFHRSTKELPVYKLIVSKKGLKIRAVDEDNCPGVPLSDKPCRYIFPDKFAHLSAQKAPMSALAWELTRIIGKMVIDNTGLKGAYTYALDWQKYLQPPLLPPGAVAPPGAFDLASFGPAVAKALEEQLGLQLDSGSGPVEVLVIDHVERPSEN